MDAWQVWVNEKLVGSVLAPTWQEAARRGQAEWAERGDLVQVEPISTASPRAVENHRSERKLG